VYDQNKDRSDDTKDNFYEELEHQSIPWVPHENFVRRFQWKGREKIFSN
jgi:hypothetical protein